MLTQVVVAAAGLVLLTVAADQLVLGAARLAWQLRLAPVVVGVVVIGIGTSTPEFLVSGIAAMRGDSGIALGNLVGSNVFNLTLILGVAALCGPLLVRSTVVRREAPLTVAGMALFGLVAMWGLGWVAGVLLAAAGGGALWLLLRWSRRVSDPALTSELEDDRRAAERHPLGREALRTGLGLVGTLVGAQLLVVSATAIATGLGVPDVVIGFTLVAAGTSLPELVTAVQSQRRGQPDLVVGNLLGSNLFNSLFGGAIVAIGSAATGRSVPAQATVLMAMVLVGVAAWGMFYRRYRVTRVEAMVLLAAYAAVLPLLT